MWGGRGLLGGRTGWERGWLWVPRQESKAPLAPLAAHAAVGGNCCSCSLKDQAQTGPGTPLTPAAAPQASPPWVSSRGQRHGPRSGTAWGTRGTGSWGHGKHPSAFEQRHRGAQGLRALVAWGHGRPWVSGLCQQGLASPAFWRRREPLSQWCEAPGCSREEAHAAPVGGRGPAGAGRGWRSPLQCCPERGQQLAFAFSPAD